MKKLDTVLKRVLPLGYVHSVESYNNEEIGYGIETSCVFSWPVTTMKKLDTVLKHVVADRTTVVKVLQQ